MYFTIDGTRYRIHFEHGLGFGHRIHGYCPRQFTNCCIEQDFNSPVATGWWPAARVAVARYYKDHDNRELARKAALTKALARMPFTREQRAQVWEVYLHRADPKQSRAV